MMIESRGDAAAVLTTRTVDQKSACCCAPRMLRSAACSKYLDKFASNGHVCVASFNAVYTLMLGVDDARHWLIAIPHVAANDSTQIIEGRALVSRFRVHLPNAAMCHVDAPRRPARDSRGPRAARGRCPVVLERKDGQSTHIAGFDNADLDIYTM